MVYQVIQDSAWAYVLSVVVLLGIATLITAAVKGKLTDGFLMAGLLALSLCSAGALTLFYQNTVQNNVSFSQQLMDEYHATSNHPWSRIKAEAMASGASNAVFTRDGKETPVLIKLATHNDKTATVQFFVLDDKSLYSKP